MAEEVVTLSIPGAEVDGETRKITRVTMPLVTARRMLAKLAAALGPPKCSLCLDTELMEDGGFRLPCPCTTVIVPRGRN